MEPSIHFANSGATALMAAHLIAACVSILLSYIREESIITDRINKYIFFVISLLYSYVAPKVIIGSLLYLPLSNETVRLCMWGGWTIFVLLQFLIYRLLNRVEMK